MLFKNSIGHNWNEKTRKFNNEKNMTKNCLAKIYPPKMAFKYTKWPISGWRCFPCHFNCIFLQICPHVTRFASNKDVVISFSVVNKQSLSICTPHYKKMLTREDKSETKYEKCLTRLTLSFIFNKVVLKRDTSSIRIRGNESWFLTVR